MCSECDGQGKRDRFGVVTTSHYDGKGNLLGIDYGTGSTSQNPVGAAEKEKDRFAPAHDARPGASAGARAHLRRSFEFCLGDADRQEQAVACRRAGTGELVVAIERVRTFLRRHRSDVTAGGAIGAVEVRAELRGDWVVCTVGLHDLGPADGVVVQVDVAVYICGGQP
jgi:hypothetical protein